MACETIDPDELLAAVARAISGLKKNSKGMIELGPHQYYYFLAASDAYMSELRLAPKVELVGDLCDDIDFVNSDGKASYGDPYYLLERLSHILRYLASQPDLADDKPT